MTTRDRSEQPSDVTELTRFGFRWGPFEVQRTALLPTGRVLRLLVGEREALEVYVSKTGRSVRVFKNGKELR